VGLRNFVEQGFSTISFVDVFGGVLVICVTFFFLFLECQHSEAPPIDASLGMVLVVDTSILLHQMDWVSHSKTKNLVLAQTVMQELRTQVPSVNHNSIKRSCNIDGRDVDPPLC